MMTTRELIEAAQLDALGLLDESERDAFEQALAAAPPELKAQIRAEQARAADFDPLLTAELAELQPPASLRERVLRAFREAVTAAAGSRTSVHEAAERRASSIDAVPVRRARRVNPLWRAAAIGFMAVAVVFGVAALQVLDRFDDLKRSSDSNLVTDIVNTQIGPAAQVRDMLFDQATQRLTFAPVQANFVGEAAVFYNADWSGKARIFCRNLPQRSGVYKVVVNDGDSTREIATLEGVGGLSTHEISVSVADLSKLAIVLVAQDGIATTVLTIRA